MRKIVFILFLMLTLSALMPAQASASVSSSESKHYVAKNNVGSVNTVSSATTSEIAKAKPGWTLYIWIIAAFILVAVIGFTENLLKEEKEKIGNLQPKEKS
jgi:peptidoglycan/LPS O-acetylase OafA/YrhL